MNICEKTNELVGLLPDDYRKKNLHEEFQYFISSRMVLAMNPSDC